MHNTPRSLQQMLPLMQQCFEKGQTVSFVPNGESMRPMLQGGRDTVVLKAMPEQPEKYAVILYRRENGQLVLHRVMRVREDGCWFMGDGQFSREFVRKEQMLAQMSAFTRNGKTYSSDAAAYRLYVAVWTALRPLRRFFLCAGNWIKRRFSA